MNENAAITVLMPAYNAAPYIAEAIASVLQQSFTHFELLIINDGSTDNTETIIRNIADSRIRLINQPHSGVAAALNLGLLNAAAPLIARFDADDICSPQRLQTQYDFLQQHPQYVLVGSDVQYADKNGEPLYRYNSPAYRHEEITRYITSGCPFIHSSVLYKKSIALELGGYDVKAHTFEDYRLWIQFVNKGKVCNLPEPLITVRLNPESVTVDEKLRGRRFAALKKQMLLAPAISAAQETALLQILQNQNFSRFKKYSYNILVAKKYLWNNYQPVKARENVRLAIGFKPLQLTGYGLWLLSFLPKKFVTKFYSGYKSMAVIK
jgi:glycosyltransferase involved in cell wall biosynthesis